MPKYTYAVSKIHVIENRLLNKDDLLNLLDYENEDLFLNFISRRLGHKDSHNFFDLIKLEKQNLYIMIDDLKLDVDLLLPFKHKIDFLNLNAAIKNACLGEYKEDMYFSGGTVTSYDMYEYIKNKDFENMPKFIKFAAKDALGYFKQNDLSLFNACLDRALIETFIKDSMETKDEFLINYSLFFSCLSNIKIALRGTRHGLCEEFFVNTLTECDGLNKNELIIAALGGEEDIMRYIKHTKYKAVISDKDDYEALMENLNLKMIISKRTVPFGVSPIYAYILEKMHEIKMLKMVYEAIKNSVIKDFVRERIEKIYA